MSVKQTKDKQVEGFPWTPRQKRRIKGSRLQRKRDRCKKTKAR